MIKYSQRNFAHKKPLVKCLYSGCMHPGIWMWLMVITLADNPDSIRLALAGTRLTDFPFPDAGAILLPGTALRQQLCAFRDVPWPRIPQRFDLLTPCFPRPTRGDLNHWCVMRCLPSSVIWINFTYMLEEGSTATNDPVCLNGALCYCIVRKAVHVFLCT